ncbi:MAG: patatin-like phospholipase family protein [Patescibacteria group bacterium]|nr:patatin-like phospholipase family protein [Patescibacteria group bacterium]
MTNRKTIGLALGSGGVRGLTHVGVIKVLEENNIKIDYIAGSSIGAWVGAHYALYQDIEALTEFTVGKRKEKIISFLDTSFSGGLIKGKKLEKMLNIWLNNANFDDLKIPLSIVATDLIKAEPIILNSGSLAFAARASMAIPGYFKPIIWDDKILVDGGLTNPVPDDVVKVMGADIVIAVNLNNFQIPTQFKKKEPSVSEVAFRTNEIVQCYLAKYSLKQADIIIQPPLGEHSSWTKYFVNGKGEEMVKIGEDAMRASLPELLKKISA